MVEVGDVAGLAKPVDTQWDDRVAGDRAEPRQRRRVEVADGDECVSGRSRANSRSATRHEPAPPANRDVGGRER
jgi:hypothetical protein